MNVRKIAALGVILLVNRLSFADASYQETSQITGGTMVDPVSYTHLDVYKRQRGR